MTHPLHAAHIRRVVVSLVAGALLACGPTDSPLDPVVDTQAPTAVVEVLDASGAVDADSRVGFGEAFSLDGARSTDAGGGQIVRYAWSLPDGSVIEVTASRLAVLDFVSDPLPVGRHVFGLTVTDDSGNESVLAQANVIVADMQAPTAVLEILDASGAVDADGRVGFGEAFFLDGARSTDAGGGQIYKYAWSLPDGSVVEVTASRLAVLDFVSDPLPVGRHVFGLTVTDDSGNESVLAQVNVIIVDRQAPTAVLDVLDAEGRVVTDGRVEFGEPFFLDGARSTDAGSGQIGKYSWLLPDGSLIELPASRLAVLDVVSDPFPVGQHTFGLTVTDDSGNESVLAQLTVIVVDTQAPTAVLEATDASGRPLLGNVRVGSAFSLSGRRSFDVGGQVAQYRWSLPDGTTRTTAASTLAVTDIVRPPLGIGQHTFGLTVIDDSGNESTLVQVTVTVVF